MGRPRKAATTLSRTECGGTKEGHDPFGCAQDKCIVPLRAE